MTDVREVHDEIESILGREIEGIGMAGDTLTALVLTDTDSLSQSETNAIIDQFGDVWRDTE